MTGAFTDTEGVSFSGAGVVAKGFSADGRLGVVLWNTTDKQAAFTLSVPNGELVGAEEPEAASVDAFAPLAPQTVRLVTWRR